MYHCKFCGKECKNKMSQTKHQQYCKSNENRIKNGNFGHKGYNQYTKAKRLGLPKPEVSEETKKKITRNRIGVPLSSAHKIKMKAAMKLAVENHPDSYSASNVSGRTKSFDYIDSFGNKTKLKGRWELAVANFFNEKGINWTNYLQWFEYEWKGAVRKYFPDFYLPDLDLYVEVKGYEREMDRAKWKVVPNIIILRYNEINQIRNKTFDLGPLAQG